MRLTLFCAMALVSWTSATAAELPKALKCAFDGGQFVVVEGGKFKSSHPGKLELTFAAITEQSAQLIGNIGAETIPVINGREALSFLEVTGVGNVNLTTVYKGALPDGRLPAAHSRHTGRATDPTITQFLGTCEMLR